jgi:DNA-binding transcriptional LysR family regulator
MLRLAEEARSVVARGDEPGGTLIVGAPESLCAYRLPPVLSRFRRRFPRVEQIVRPGICADFRRELAEGRLDVGFLLEPPIVQPSLHIEPLVAEPLHLVTYPGHPLTRLERVEPRDLAGEPLLLTEAGCSDREPFEHTLTRAAARPGIILEFGSVEAIKQCVMAGMGLSILPAIAVEAELAQGASSSCPGRQATRADDPDRLASRQVALAGPVRPDRPQPRGARRGPIPVLGVLTIRDPGLILLPTAPRNMRHGA